MGRTNYSHSPPRGLFLVLWYHTEKHYIEIKIPLISNSTNVLICEETVIKDIYDNKFFKTLNFIYQQ